MPGSGLTNSYSDLQLLPSFGVKGRIVSNANTIYTCPTGKKAKITGRGIIDGLGTDTKVGLAIKTGTSFFPITRFTTVDNAVIIDGIVVIAAGEGITTIGNSGGTNAGIDIDIVVTEYSV